MIFLEFPMRPVLTRARLVCSVLLTLVLVTACGAAQPSLRQPSDVVLSVQDMTCQTCGGTVSDVLMRTPGVANTSFDKQKVEVAVHFDAAVTLPGDLVKRISHAGFHAQVGPGHGSYAPPEAFGTDSDVSFINRDGADVDIEAHRVAGKVTVVDFGAKWCGPCREVDKTMAALLLTAPDVAVRKVDVADWNTPVAKHYLADVTGLPYVVVFDKKGKRVDTIAGLDLPRLASAISQAKVQ
jgi:thiol-disulfide isomerase/thioredoxin